MSRETSIAAMEICLVDQSCSNTEPVSVDGSAQEENELVVLHRVGKEMRRRHAERGKHARTRTAIFALSKAMCEVA